MPCFGHRWVTFDAEIDRPGPGSLQGQFEAARGRLGLRDRRPSVGASREWPAMPCMEWLPALGIATG